MRQHLLKLLSLPAALLLAAGCQANAPISDILEGRQIDYESHANQKRQELQYPPDLLSTAQGVEGTISLSEYTIASIPSLDEEEVIDVPTSKVAYQRSGSLRWVQVDLTPNDAWGATRAFWDNHLGFGLDKESANLGVMETGWLDLRERLATPGLLGEAWDTLLNRLNDSGQRDKFVTRLERSDSGGTDIYITHRHVAASFDKDGLFSGYTSQSSEVQLEVEMMRRLMLYLAGRQLVGDNSDLNEQVALVEATTPEDYQLAGNELLIRKPFQESWQLVQVGLNRGGFNIEDRDYDNGVIYIQHSGGPGSDRIFGEAETNWFGNLFGEEKPLLRSIKLVFHREDDERVRLTTEAVEGDDPLSSEQSGIVLELLHQYLP